LFLNDNGRPAPRRWCSEYPAPRAPAGLAAGSAGSRPDTAIDLLASTGTQKLRKLLSDAQQTLLALKVELREDDVERDAPITLPLPANDAVRADGPLSEQLAAMAGAANEGDDRCCPCVES